MKKCFVVSLALCLVLALLTACGRAGQPASSAAQPADSVPAASSAAESAPEEEIYLPPEEDLAMLEHTWICLDETPRGQISYRLTISHDGDQGLAEMPIQDETLQLLGLYHGSWIMTEPGVLYLELVGDGMADSIIPEDRRHLRGEYLVGWAGESLALTPVDGADPLLPGGNDLYVFDLDQGFGEGCAVPEVSEQLQDDLCRGALEYYAEQTGTAYPGVAAVDEIGPDGVVIHLYEDMGDHTATAAWYSIDPNSFMGYDIIMGVDIDFAPYIAVG